VNGVVTSLTRIPRVALLFAGGPGDVSVFERVEGSVTFVDTTGHTRRGTVFLRLITAIKAGRPLTLPFPRPVPYPQPFSSPEPMCAEKVQVDAAVAQTPTARRC